MLLEINAYRKGSKLADDESKKHLANWGVLHAHIVAQDKKGQLTPHYVVHLLRVELATRKRLVLATRLLGVYHRLAREENERRLAEALGDSK